MATRRNPTVRQRRLAGELRSLRKRSGLDRAAAMNELACDESKISRIETGGTGIRLVDLRLLLKLYDASDQEKEEIEQIWKESRKKGWWTQYKSQLDSAYATYVQVEWDAVALYEVENSLVPGLLQTQSYTKELIKTQNPSRTEEALAVQLEVKKQRQEVFNRANPPTLWAVVAESVLYHEVGPPETIKEQLQTLLKCTSAEWIELQVLPIESKANSLLYGPFVVMSFESPEESDVVYQEGHRGTVYYEHEDDVESYRSTFRRIQMEAADSKKSRSLIRKAIQKQE